MYREKILFPCIAGGQENTVVIFYSPPVQEKSLHIQWGELRGGKEERGEEIMQNRAVCGDIIWRPDSNEPPGPAWPYIFRKCPVALKRLIVQENNFVEL